MIEFISVNNAATDGDTHFGVAKYVGMQVFWDINQSKKVS